MSQAMRARGHNTMKAASARSLTYFAERQRLVRLAGGTLDQRQEAVKDLVARIVPFEGQVNAGEPRAVDCNQPFRGRVERRWIPARSATPQANRISTSLPSSDRNASTGDL
jgi:hypothetical protein